MTAPLLEAVLDLLEPSGVLADLFLGWEAWT
jgi:hypothetical protein